LTGIKIKNKQDMILAAKKLLNLGVKNVLIKGGHLKVKNVEDVFLNKSDLKVFISSRYNSKNTHGTGCTLSSAITTFYSCGKSIKKACELGIKYVNLAILSNPNYGNGHGPINHLNSMKIDKRFR
jgi:hydroxymethylpyrimidine kinase/phosphomethylpyrimidine kinase